MQITALDEAARLASLVLDLRRRRGDHLPDDLFGEAAWSLLLVMFIADAAGERINAAEVCRRAGGLPVNLGRWLRLMAERGLVARRDVNDESDLISLTPAGLHAVEACMLDARVVIRSVPG